MSSQRILVTGGAGFIGTNLVNRLLSHGHTVTILDNLSRAGCTANLTWLASTHGREAFTLIEADVADEERVSRAAIGAQRVYHLAGQVAVTTSVADPRADFAANALGTFNVLEAARTVGDDPIVIYASTNKVYGHMGDVRVVEDDTRYRYLDFPHGIPETHPLDFHSPYGCSKGAGDQYTRDYARIYGLRTVVARQSCIYGPRQFGVEDQGWLAWFIIAALLDQPISVYGNGKQVRDVLFVEDLLDAYDCMVDGIDRCAGRVYNVGGGPENTISVWSEFGPMLEQMLGRPIPVAHGDWRPGDQPIYVSDTRALQTDLGWRPQVGVAVGLERVLDWVVANQHLFSRFAQAATSVNVG